MAGDDSFFDEQSEASGVKARIIQKFFDTWARIVLPTAKAKGEKIAYIDLYCGPGRYGDNNKSTPLLVLEKAISNSDLAKNLVTIFNDENEDFIKKLKAEVEALPGIGTLTNEPYFMNTTTGPETEKHFRENPTVPSLTFIDPFGYTGLTLGLIEGVIKNWGCDCIFFFNYARINRALGTPIFRARMEALFGKERALELEAQLKGISQGRQTPHTREELIVDRLTDALKEIKGSYVRPFRFRKGGRTSHMIVFVTKHEKGYQVMKEIMAKESAEVGRGIVSFTWTDQASPTNYLFYPEFDELKRDLCEKFAGRTLTMIDVYEQHNVGTDYIIANYKDALNELEAEGRITAVPPAASRQKRNGKPTFGDGTKVTFPSRNV